MKPLTPIQASAKGESCTFNLLNCNYDHETTVLCHDTRTAFDGKRRSDARAAYGCSNCHDVMDGRTPNDMTSTLKGSIWGMAILKTHVKLMEKGLLHFEGVENKPPKQLPRRSVVR